jgi:ubiquinone/menaquinone biosynthesis C-methylase UbiE
VCRIRCGCPPSEPRSPSLNYERLYEYRFRDIDQAARAAVWSEIAPHVHGLMGNPRTVLDPAAGRGEFIESIDAPERWAVDAVDHPEAGRSDGVRFVTADIMEAELPPGHFDGVFASNFIEHLRDQEAIAAFMQKMHGVMTTGGRIAVMGPNYRYCADEYWDCADHYVPLTHVAVAEHLYAAGFEPTTVIPRFLPYSFRGRLPPSRRLTRLYLRAPLAWRLLGKQFLVIGRS